MSVRNGQVWTENQMSDQGGVTTEVPRLSGDQTMMDGDIDDEPVELAPLVKIQARFASKEVWWIRDSDITACLSAFGTVEDFIPAQAAANGQFLGEFEVDIRTEIPPEQLIEQIRTLEISGFGLKDVRIPKAKCSVSYIEPKSLPESAPMLYGDSDKLPKTLLRSHYEEKRDRKRDRDSEKDKERDRDRKKDKERESKDRDRDRRDRDRHREKKKRNDYDYDDFREKERDKDRERRKDRRR